MPRPRLPIGAHGERIYIATSLHPDLVQQIDAAAARAGECRSEYMRQAVLARLGQESAA